MTDLRYKELWSEHNNNSIWRVIFVSIFPLYPAVGYLTGNITLENLTFYIAVSHILNMVFEVIQMYYMNKKVEAL